MDKEKDMRKLSLDELREQMSEGNAADLLAHSNLRCDQVASDHMAKWIRSWATRLFGARR